MTKYVIFLRGVNVGGNSSIKMSELKSVLEDHGFENVTTYINSGNIIVNSKDSPVKIKETFKNIIEKHFTLSIEMIIKSK